MELPQPQGTQLDISALSRIFNTFTNSYKFLYFQAILNLLKKEGLPNCEIVLPLRSLAIEMAVLAWYPKSYFHLEFGPQDQLGRVLEQISPEKASSIANGELQRHLRAEISRRYDELDLQKILLRYVPYALLKSFFEKETVRLEGIEYERLVRKLSGDLERPLVPLYRFRDNDHVNIHIPQEWVQYLATHFGIIENWARFLWAKFLQKRNPNVPAIIEKLVPPGNRQSLVFQTSFWNHVIENRSVYCVYSGQRIRQRDFDLDHFIPWSFVGHDELWNLVPVHKSANRSKGNRLPARQYLAPFIALQCLALSERSISLSESVWKRTTESYVSALKIDYPQLLQTERVESAYLTLIEPLITIARQIGFAGDWEFR